MSDLELALKVGTALIVLFGFTFTIFWKIISDVKKSAHKRIDVIQKDMNQCVENKDIDRIERIINGHRQEICEKMNNLTGRIDNLVLTISSNGKVKST